MTSTAHENTTNGTSSPAEAETPAQPAHASQDGHLSPEDVDKLRDAYRVVYRMIKREYGMRDKVLSGTRRAQGMQECDFALQCLRLLGAAVGARTDAEQLQLQLDQPSQPSQMGLPFK